MGRIPLLCNPLGVESYAAVCRTGPKMEEWTAHEHEGVCLWVLLLSFQWYRTADTNFNLAPGGCTLLTFPCPRLFCIHYPPATPAILCCAGKDTRQGESPGCLIRLKYSFMYQGRLLKRGTVAANRLQVLAQIRQGLRTRSHREIHDEGVIGLERMNWTVSQEDPL